MMPPQQQHQQQQRSRPTTSAARRHFYPVHSMQTLLVLGPVLLLSCLTMTAAFLVPALGGGISRAAARPSSSHPSAATTTRLAMSADPGEGEFVKRRSSSSTSSGSGRGNSTAAGGRAKLPPMKETMQLLFSPDKRQGRCKRRVGVGGTRQEGRKPLALHKGRPFIGDFVSCLSSAFHYFTRSAVSKSASYATHSPSLDAIFCYFHPSCYTLNHSFSPFPHPSLQSTRSEPASAKSSTRCKPRRWKV